MFGGSAQLKQLQAENDKLVTEYRAQRDKVAKLQETNVALEQRVAEAEKLLARSGHNLPSSRLSQIPGRQSSSSTVSALHSTTSGFGQCRSGPKVATHASSVARCYVTPDYGMHGYNVPFPQKGPLDG